MHRLCITFRHERNIGHVFRESYRPTLSEPTGDICARASNIRPSTRLYVIVCIVDTHIDPHETSQPIDELDGAPQPRSEHDLASTALGVTYIDDMPRHDIAPLGVACLDRLSHRSPQFYILPCIEILSTNTAP